MAYKHALLVFLFSSFAGHAEAGTPELVLCGKTFATCSTKAMCNNNTPYVGWNEAMDSEEPDFRLQASSEERKSFDGRSTCSK
jgi:hypothetical protein